MTDPALQLEEVMDREAIRDCLHRYCRGIDRMDEAALRSAYWPDATDQHGPYSGSAEGFIDWALAALVKSERSVHQISNVLIALRPGGAAAVESYFTAFQRAPDTRGAMRQFFLLGRYVDWFEKRVGEWRVAKRLVVYDWVEEQSGSTSNEAERFGVRQPIGGNYPNDPIYGLLGYHPT